MTGLTHPQPQANTRKRKPRDWHRIGLITGITLCAIIGGAAAIVASFIFQTGFANATGWGQWAPLYPAGVDATGAMALLVGALAARHTDKEKAKRIRRIAAAIAILAILGSMAGNAAAHWYATGRFDFAVTMSGLAPALGIALIILLVTEGSALWAPNTSPTHTDAATDPSASSNAGSTATPPKRSHPKRRTSQPSTTGNAPAAANSAGTDPTTWTSFHGWTRAELQGRSTAQLLQWIKDQELERASLKDLQTLGRLSQRRAQELKRSLVTSNASTSHADSEPAADSNGWH